MAFQKILVALDCSSLTAEIVFQQAIKLAKTEGSHLMLFHCISWDNKEQTNPILGIGTLGNANLHTTLQQLYQNSWSGEIAQVRDRLHSFYEEAKSEGVSVEYEYKMGNPSTTICEQAEQWGADLVIIGRKTFMKWSDILSRKVSRYVLDHADCSVFVIQTGISAMDSLPVAEAQAALN